MIPGGALAADFEAALSAGARHEWQASFWFGTALEEES